MRAWGLREMNHLSFKRWCPIGNAYSKLMQQSPLLISKSWKQAAGVALLLSHRASANSPGKPCWDKELSKKMDILVQLALGLLIDYYNHA